VGSAPLPLVAVAAICLGASLGALARWGLANGLNSLHPALPPGTLIANLVGGYAIGLALAYFAQQPTLSPAWRLFIVTGFLGALTTFSAFSAEVVDNLMGGRIGWALATVFAHVIGSVAMTVAGIATVRLLMR
jgi:fluoride exporter